MAEFVRPPAAHAQPRLSGPGLLRPLITRGSADRDVRRRCRCATRPGGEVTAATEEQVSRHANPGDLAFASSRGSHVSLVASRARRDPL